MNELDERRWRVYVLFAVITGCVLVLATKLVYVQVVEGEQYRSLAADEHWRKDTIPSRRGEIRDSTGQVLATSVSFDSLYANTDQINDPASVARALAPVLSAPANELEAKLRVRQVAPTLVQRYLPAALADRIRGLGLWDVYLKSEPRRSYPQGSLASQLIGVVGTDNVGLSGLELAFNADLAGKSGSLIAERDTGGEPIALGASQYTAPEDGSDIVLTIDRFVQYVAERELDAAVREHQASGGTVIVLDPRTGAILAMASRPTLKFDAPDLFQAASLPLYRIPALSDAYEPGSCFKIVTMAAALDAGAVTPQTTFYNEGTFSYAGGVVRNSVDRPPGPESMIQTLQRSSNIGAAYAATTLGSRRFYEYVTAFGFGQPTGVELPGESSGLLRLPGRADWHDFDLATNAFGQGVAVTPLQLTVAVGAVANGGTMMKPYIVREIDGPGARRVYSPTVVKQVIRPETATTLTGILVSVVDSVEGGVVRQAAVPGYRVAGKTGTAEIPTSEGYSSATIASFVGYAPADDPRFVVLVKVDDPKDTPWGETVAAPVFHNIARDLLVYFGVAPSSAPSAQ